MGFIRCEREDPFARRVREVYRANVIPAPRAGLSLLTVIAQRGSHVELRGNLESLLRPTGEPLRLPEVVEHEAADLSGERSAELDVQVGARLLGSFLTALAGVPIPTVELQSTVWRGATRFSFEARGVRERIVDLNDVGEALTGRRVNADQPAARIYFDDSGTQMRLVSRTLVSSHVAVRAQGERSHSIEASTQGIADLLGKAEAKVEVGVEQDGAVTFSGSDGATAAFAMSHVHCTLSPAGDITLGLALGGGSYLDTPGHADDDRLVDHFPVVDDAGLIEFDEPEPVA